jgi:isopenicillin-N N-acyltransferase-like protein
MTLRIRVAGTPYERGRQYGTQARDRVHLSVQAYQRVFAHYAGWDWPDVRRAAARFEAPIAAFRPAYLDEMRGIADGAGLDLADVLAINVRTEVMYAAKARQAPLAARVSTNFRPLPAECSAFAVVPAPGDAQTATLLGQNWDWLLHSAQTLIVLEARPDDGPDFVTVVEAGLLAKAGLNAAGLGLVTNALVTDADLGAPGLPYHVLLRAILDCATVTEALKVLQAGVRSSSANYLIAHASGAALDVEAAPGDFTRLYPQLPEDGVLLHTNHCTRSTCRCGPCRTARSACNGSGPARPDPPRSATSACCSPTTPTTRTASAPIPIRTSTRSSRAPPSLRS